MSTYVASGSPTQDLSHDDKIRLCQESLNAIGITPSRVLLIPPDYTRAYSGAGELTEIYYDLLSPSAHVDIMPALGTHTPMTDEQITKFFGPKIPRDRILDHDWRNDLTYFGDVPASKVEEWSEGAVSYDIRIEVNKALVDGNYDLILSIGQIVPHEVVGMANYTKNVCVGVGGSDTINKSHFLGAAFGMERIMGRADTPVRRVFNYGQDEYLKDLPIYYVLTVIEKEANSEICHMRGFYVGDDNATFEEGCKLSQEINLTFMDEPLKKVVVYLQPDEFKSTWLGNKSVYRTRMVIADDGELIVLAPALCEFGEDPEIDRLIRKYGYNGTPATLDAVKNNPELADNLSAAAHLIHGSSEGRFSITYCPGPEMSLEDVKSVGFKAIAYDEIIKRYDPKKLTDGVNVMDDGEEIFYISNPSLGLWALRESFDA